MKLSKLISAIFSKWFFALIGLVLLSGLLLYLRLPEGLYDKLLDFVSNLLQQKYGSGGNKVKIDTGFHKLGFLVMALGVLLFTYFSFWKWFISSALFCSVIIAVGSTSFIIWMSCSVYLFPL